VPAGGERGQAGQQLPVAGGLRVEQGQNQGEAEQDVEGGVPDPGVLVPGIDPVLAALAVQPAAPLLGALPSESMRGRGRRGAPYGGSAGQPFG
jgi:hypothetical protein